MHYDAWRNAAVRNAYAVASRSLIARYRRGQPTVILLPGGMGSQFDRSLNAHTPQSRPPEVFDTVWADVGLLFNRDALTLEMDGQGRDRDRHVLIASGPLDFFIKAYDGTEQFFGELGWNFATFGYDWRRSIAENAAFLEEFLLLYKGGVQRKHNEDPLPHTTLLAHSQGGLVAKVFLHRVVDVSSWVDKVITIATPFYGTWSHQQRYFVGERILNVLHGEPEVARIVGTLPGPYVLMFLTRDRFARDGGRLGLATYPIADLDTGEPADPYDPASRTRYPSWVNTQYLADAGALLETIAAPLSGPVQTRFFNMRSHLDGNTPTALSWKRMSADFDPEKDENPIQPASTEGGGDGTVPAWAAWHAHTPDANKIELEVARNHADLAEHKEVLEIVRGLIADDRILAPAERPREDELFGDAPPPAESADVEAFVRDVRESRATRDDPRTSDPAVWRGILPGAQTMRPHWRLSPVVLAALPLLVLTACSHIILPWIDQVELHRSEPQRLVLRNTGTDPLFVMPIEEGAPRLQVEPGSSEAIDFVVATIAEVEMAADKPWLVPLDGTERDVAIMIEPEGYLQQSGPDLVFRVRNDEPARERRLSLQCGSAGWESAPAAASEHEVSLAEPPLSGVPDRICPKSP